MPTPITVPIIEDAESWIRANVPDLDTDNVAAVYPLERIDFNGCWFRDVEDGTTRHVVMADFVKALQLLCEKIGKTLFVGGLTSPHDLLDPCNWDAEVVDAYWQLVYRQEVIYG